MNEALVDNAGIEVIGCIVHIIITKYDNNYSYVAKLPESQLNQNSEAGGMV